MCKDFFIRKIKEDGAIIAFIPSEPANKGMIMSYMHVGQHGEASIDFMLHVDGKRFG